MPRQTNQFNLRLDDATRAMLDKLAEHRGVCAAHLIRELIHNRYTMLTRNIPMCFENLDTKAPLKEASANIGFGIKPDFKG